MDVLAGRKTVGTIAGERCPLLFLLPWYERGCSRYHFWKGNARADSQSDDILPGDIKVNGFPKEQSTFASMAGCESSLLTLYVLRHAINHATFESCAVCSELY